MLCEYEENLFVSEYLCLVCVGQYKGGLQSRELASGSGDFAVLLQLPSICMVFQSESCISGYESSSLHSERIISLRPGYPVKADNPSEKMKTRSQKGRRRKTRIGGIIGELLNPSFFYLDCSILKPE